MSDAGQYICHIQNEAGSATHNCTLLVRPKQATPWSSDSRSAVIKMAPNKHHSIQSNNHQPLSCVISFSRESNPPAYISVSADAKSPLKKCLDLFENKGLSLSHPLTKPSSTGQRKTEFAPNSGWQISQLSSGVTQKRDDQLYRTSPNNKQRDLENDVRKLTSKSSFTRKLGAWKSRSTQDLSTGSSNIKITQARNGAFTKKAHMDFKQQKILEPNTAIQAKVKNSQVRHFPDSEQKFTNKANVSSRRSPPIQHVTRDEFKLKDLRKENVIQSTVDFRKVKLKPMQTLQPAAKLSKQSFEKGKVFEEYGSKLLNVTDKSINGQKILSIVSGLKIEDTSSCDSLQSLDDVPEMCGISDHLQNTHVSNDSSFLLNKQKGKSVLLVNNDKKTSENKTSPSFQQPLQNQHVQYGGQAILKCEVRGLPVPDIEWSINQAIIKPSRFFQMSYVDHLAQLVVAEAFSEDEGEYTCLASNSLGSTASSCYLTVEASSFQSNCSESHSFEGCVSVPPCILSQIPSNMEVQRGQSVCISLTFAGKPAPEVAWFHQKSQLVTDCHFQILRDETSSSLLIKEASSNLAGCYTVTISNGLGSDCRSTTVHVEDVPDPPLGQPHVYDYGMDSVSISWCSPAFDGGCQITHYAIQGKDVISEDWTTYTSNCQTTSYHVQNLIPEHTYQFRVQAGNKFGFGEPSHVSDPVTLIDTLSNSWDYESDGASEVFSPTLDYRGSEELPFEPRQVIVRKDQQFEDFYDLLRQVGKGKFGQVYQCCEKSSHKVLAVKMVKCQEKEKQNVRHEVDIMNRLSAHPKLLMLWDAFESPQAMFLVMEYVGAGELFERVIREDFELTEQDCRHFLYQICCGVAYMHSKAVLHLDLKPENILCVSDHSNQIKIIDFGLARIYHQGESVKVLFGTPEFIAPEVINYDEVNYSTDLWSVGVICFILLSGLSPFLGDNDAETLANVTRGEYDFDHETFDDISDHAKDFIKRLLVKCKEKRDSAEQCLQHPWLIHGDARMRCKRLNTERLKCFMARRKWQVEEELEVFEEHHATASAPLPSSSAYSVQWTADEPQQISDPSLQAKVDSMFRRKNKKSSAWMTESLHTESDQHLIKAPLAGPKQAKNLHQLSEENTKLSPYFVKKMVNCKSFAGDVARFDVRVTGEPSPAISWYFEEGEVHTDDKHIIELREKGRASLIVRNLAQEDEGEYSCQAANRHGKAICSAQLSICRTGAF